MQLTRLAITRPITILMLVLTLVILGWQSRMSLPVDLYPSVDFPMLYISTSYAGTGPEEMETLVTKPIEDQLSTISGLKKLSSTSSEGVSAVSMEFEIGTNLSEVAADVHSKLDALRNSLPQDCKAPVVIKIDIGSLPVIQLNLASTRRSSIELRRLADDIMKDRLSQLPGVASVNVSGGDIREVRVEVDKNRLEAYNLSISQIVSALANENLNLPSGTISEDRRDFAVRVMGEFTDPDQILNVRIPNATGNPNLTIRDVATVHDTVAKPTSYTRVDGGSSVTLTVQKQSDGNTVKVVDAVYAALENITGKPFTPEGLRAAKAKNFKPSQSPVLPADVNVTTSQDQSVFIKDALNDVYSSLWMGALLAVMIVFLFLHSIRSTFIVALAIPTSMIATFLVMRFLGFSVNMMSMLGLSLSVGILVDDSIVVLENIHRHLRMGESPKEAAINGRSEIGLAAITITMVDVVVFVPIAFMGGIVGQFFRQFGIVVATATLFSLFMSFTLTPMLASRWSKSHAEEEAEEERQREHPSLFHRFTNWWENTLYAGIDRSYRQILAWSLDHHVAVICMGLIVLLGAVGSAMPKPQTAPLMKSLPEVLVLLGLIACLWSVVRLIKAGWARFLFFLLAFAASTAAAIALTKFVSVGSPVLVIVELVVIIGIAAFFLSLPVNRSTNFSARSVAIPLISLVAVIVIICVWIPTKFTFQFQPAVDRRQFSIKVEEEVGTPLSVTDATCRMIEQTLMDKTLYPETKTISVTVGSSGSGGVFGGGMAAADQAQLNVELVDYQRGKMRTTDEIIHDVNTRYSMQPGVKITASLPAGGPGGSPIDIEISGSDLHRTQVVANQVADIVKHTPGTYSTDISWREGRPEMQAHIDRDRAAQYGISVAQIANALRTSMEGDTSLKYRENGKEYDIRVSLPEDQRDLVTQLPDMVVGTASNGRPVHLYEVVRLEPAGGPTKIERTNRQRSVTITAQLAAGYAGGNAQQQIDPEIAKLDLSGVTVNWAGQAQMMKESATSMFNALFLSIVLVFILMAALFESLISPFIIMLTVPLAIGGALFALTFTQKSLSIISMIGFIMLVGLVTKNAILMVDFTNTLRRERGLDRRQALLEAGPTRLRPIIMTTLAMIFGMLPTAVALSKGSEMRQPMAIAVIGGLLLALFLSLLMVPSFYEIIDDFGISIDRLKRRLLRIKDPMPGLPANEEANV